MLRHVAAAVATAAMLSLAACGQSAEQAGENADNQIEETFQGERDLGDGAFEQTGEAIDEATGQQRSDDGADALSDATDGDASTNP